MNKYYIKFYRYGSQCLVVPCYASDCVTVHWYAKTMLHQLSQAGDVDSEYQIQEGSYEKDLWY